MDTSTARQFVKFLERKLGTNQDLERELVPGHTEECVIDGVHYVSMADNRGECLAGLVIEE